MGHKTQDMLFAELSMLFSQVSCFFLQTAKSLSPGNTEVFWGSMTPDFVGFCFDIGRCWDLGC